MITSIYLENWKSHEKTKMEFHKGTNVLIGKMGAGKSSVMDAMTFALFGTFPLLQSRKITLDSCIMNKPSIKERAIVKVNFKTEKGEYTVIREISQGKGVTKAELRKGDLLIEGPQSKRVTESVQSVLNVSYELFSRAVYSEQNQIDYFLQIPPNQRKKVIDKLLQIDRFENSRQTAGGVVNRLKVRLEDKKQEIGRIEEEKISQEKITEEENLRKIREEFSEYKTRVTNIETEVVKQKKELEQMEEQQKEFAEKQTKQREKEVLRQSISKRISELEDKVDISSLMSANEEAVESSKKVMEEKLREKESLKNNVGTKVGEKAKLETEITSLCEQINRMVKEEEFAKKTIEENKESGKELDQIRALIDSLKEKIAKAGSERGRQAKRIESLEEHKENCPVCKSEITEEKRTELINEAKNEEKLAANAMTESQKQLENMSTIKLEERVRSVAIAERKLEELQKEDHKALKKKLSDDQKRLTDLISNLEKLRVQENQVEKDVEEKRAWLLKAQQMIEQKKEYNSLNLNLQELEKLVEEIEGWFKQNTFNENKLTQLRSDVGRNSEELAEVKSKNEMGERLLKEKEARIMEYSKQLEKVKSLRNESEWLSKMKEDTGVFKKALEETQIHLRAEFTHTVNAALNDVWSRIYPYGDFVSLRLNVEGEDYLLQLQDRQGRWVDVEGTTSGGERSTAALCLRIAFSLVLTRNLSWLVLDEPTHNLDTRGVNLLSEALREHLPELVDQVFIITHDEEMGKAGETLYRLEREKEKDEPTQIQLITED